MKILNKRMQQFNFYPEKVIQFGEGNFMRGFVDWQLQQMNKQGLFNGSAVVVQPINQGLGEKLSAQDNLYTVMQQGILNKKIVDTAEIITTISRVINPYTAWEDFLLLAEDDQLELVVSNTTEAGIAFNDKDKLTDRPPESFPGKLTQLLYRRFKLGKAGFTIIPCELIDRNGEKLKEIILKYVALWHLEPEFVVWLEKANTFCCSLVDRIVPGYPKDKAAELNAAHGYQDDVMVMAEPFMLWVIEGPQHVKELLPLAQADLNVVVTDDMTPFRERKVHLLNGPHTAMVPLALLAGLETVEEVMKDDDFSAFVNNLMADELIPMLRLPKDDLEAYAQQVKERFRNPFVRHELTSIALNSISKFRTRLLPILLNYQKQNQTLPVCITAALAAYLVLYRDESFAAKDDQAVLDIFAASDSSSNQSVVEQLRNPTLWGCDLTVVHGLTDAVTMMVTEITKNGTRRFVQEINKNTQKTMAQKY